MQLSWNPEVTARRVMEVHPSDGEAWDGAEGREQGRVGAGNYSFFLSSSFFVFGHQDQKRGELLPE